MADKRTLVTDPVSGREYWQVEADFRPTSQTFTGKPWHECALCGWVDSEGAMTKLKGRFYCNKNGCAVEVSS